MTVSQRTIKSAERTLALFEFFSRRSPPYTVTSVSEALHLPQSSTSMLLHNLTKLGYLEHDRALRTFSPSIRVALLGSWIDRRFDSVPLIGPLIAQLQQRVEDTAFLVMQNGSAAQYVMVQRAKDPEHFRVTSGQHQSLTCSAAGRVLLSLKTDAEVLAWARRCNVEAHDERLKVREMEFLDLIRKIRKDGFALTDGDMKPGIGALAIMVPSPMGMAPLALGVSGASNRINARQELILTEMRTFAESLEPQSKAAVS